jgi:hypothetical protein
MSVRTWRLLAASVIISAAVGWMWTPSAGAASRISYSGQSFSVKTTVSSTTTVLADTGSLPSSGGALEASSLSGTVSQTVTSTTLHAATIGQGDRVRSEASVGNLAITAGLNSITADLAMSRSMALSQGVRASVSGNSHVVGLVVNGTPVAASGQPNQTVALPDGQLIINQQITSGSGDTGSITVNALHLVLSSGTDVVLGSSRAGVVAGSQNCSNSKDFATGGGWIPPEGGAKQTFGIVGGVEQNEPFEGHVLYVNHATNDRLEGRITNYVPGTGNFREMDGVGEFNGQSQTFHIRVVDASQNGTGDEFRVTFLVPPRVPPEQGGVIEGGNVQIHEVCR